MRLRIFFRTILYSLALVSILGIATFSLYRSSAQVEARWQLALRSIVTTMPRFQGCREPFFGVVTLERLEIPASPVIVERNALELEGIRFTDPDARRMFRFHPSVESRVDRPTVRVNQGTLWLEHQVAVSAGVELERWNLSDLVHAPMIADLLEARHAQVLLDRVSVRFRDLRPSRQELNATVSLRDLEIRYANPEGVAIEADLAEGDLWSGGRLFVTWGKAGWSLRGIIEDLRGPQRWLDLGGDAARSLWDRFRPEGTCDVDLRNLSLDGTGNVELEAWVRHYDTAFALGHTGLALQRLSGRMRVSRNRIELGEKERGELVHADLMGSPVSVAGSLEERSGNLTIGLQSSSIEGFLGDVLGKEQQPLANLSSLLRPAGSLTGALAYRYSSRESESLQGDVQISGVVLDGVRVLQQVDGGVRFKKEWDARGASTGSGELQLRSADLSGMGRASGDLSFDWSAGAFHFKCSDLKVEKKVPEPVEAGVAAPERQVGSLIVEGTWSDKSGLESLELRLISVPVLLGSLRSNDVRGQLKYVRGSQASQGRVDFGPVTIPQGALAKDLPALNFKSGEARVRFDESARRFVLRSFKLSGDGRSVRAAGTIELAGEASLVAFLDEGPSSAGLLRLGDDSEPAQWKAVARGNYRAFRLTGPLSALESREIASLDPAFIPGK